MSGISADAEVWHGALECGHCGAHNFSSKATSLSSEDYDRGSSVQKQNPKQLHPALCLLQLKAPPLKMMLPPPAVSLTTAAALWQIMSTPGN